MGIDFSHCDAHWSYGGFHDFRIKVANAIGIDLPSMEGFGGSTKWGTVNDDIVPLLFHSDCDGELAPDVCKTVADRLEQIIAPWEDEIYSDKSRAEELIAGMRNAAARNEHLQFH